MKIYILKEEDEVRFTSRILGAYRNEEKAIEQLEKEALVKKYSSEEKLLNSYKSQRIIGYSDEDYDGNWDITRILNVIEINVE